MEYILFFALIIISVLIVNFATNLLMQVLGADMMFISIRTKLIAYAFVFIMLFNLVDSIFQ